MSAEAHLEVYRRFTGRLRPARFPAWALYTSGLRTALKQRRALFILYLPALITTVILCFVVYIKFTVQSQLGNESRLEAADFEQLMAHQLAAHAEQMLSVVNLILQYSKATGLFALLAVAWFASGLFCEDRRAGAHQLYFARPITRLDYFLGKFLVAVTFASMAMLVPLLLVCVMAAVSSPDWAFLRDEWDVFLRVIAFSAWAEAVCHGRITQPIERRYNACQVVKRARGEGRINRIEGLASILTRYGPWVCSVELLPVGTPRRNWKATLLSDGWMVVRHPHLETCLEMADHIAHDVQIFAG
jgi:hypothetical protein